MSLHFVITTGLQLSVCARNAPPITLAKGLLCHGYQVTLILDHQYLAHPVFDELEVLGASIIYLPKLALHIGNIYARFIKLIQILKTFSIIPSRLKSMRLKLGLHDYRTPYYRILRRKLNQLHSERKIDILVTYAGQKWVIETIKWASSKNIFSIYLEANSFQDFSFGQIDPYKELKEILPKLQAFVAHSFYLETLVRETGHCGKIWHLPFSVPDCGYEIEPIRKNVVTFGTACRLEYSKGIDRLIQAANELKKQGHENFRVKIAGLGSYRETLEKDIQNKELADIVDICQPFYTESEMKTFFNSIDVFMLLSRVTVNEGQPLAIIEALSFGKPVIASKVSGIPELLSQGSGILVSSEDIDSVVIAMNKFLKQDTETWNFTRKLARSQYEQNHKVDNMINNFLRLCEKSFKEFENSNI